MMQAASAVSKKLYSHTIRTTFFDEHGNELGVGLVVEDADIFTILTQYPDRVEEMHRLFKREVSRLAFWLN